MLLGVGGYFLTSTTIRRDRDEAAERRARVEAVHAQEVLGRARAYVDGLAAVLAQEPEPGQARFARWAGATSASVGLNDVLWVERVPAVRPAPLRARARGAHLPAHAVGPPRPRRRPRARTCPPRTRAATGRSCARAWTCPSFPALAAAIRDRARIFAVGASPPGDARAGARLLPARGRRFARAGAHRGYLVAFVPRGWFITTLGGDPRNFAVVEDGQRIEGQLDSVQASAGFEMLGRDWRIDVAREPQSGLQSMLPWLALAWPFAVAGIAFAIGRAITQRRRAQREVERIFELSLDMICVIDPDGRFKAVNPAFERTVGYPPEALLGRPFLDFVHPEEREAAVARFGDIVGGDVVSEFETRWICADGSERWLQWSARAVPEQNVVHSIGRDVTERRRIDAELRDAQRTAEARGAELQVRAGEQAALRRVATVVAREASQAEVFEAIRAECERQFGTEDVRLVRFEDGPSQVVVASSETSATQFPVGSCQPLEGENPVSRVFRTGQPARMDDYDTAASGPIGERGRALNLRSVLAVPIGVEGRLWGAMGVGTQHEVLPPDTEARLVQFTDLMATAIANAESHARAERLAEEQAALRRVATLVAEGATPTRVLDAVAGEMEALLDADQVALNRFEPGAEIVVLAHRGLDVERTPVGSRVSIEGESATAAVRRTGKPARMEGYASAPGPLAELARATGLRSSVSAPITVQGRLWGVITASWKGELPPPPDTEERMAKFAGLLDTAIANIEARTEVERLADEQAALRRVATLVAHESPEAQVFAAVAEEVRALFDARAATIARADADDSMTVVAASGTATFELPVGRRVALDSGMTMGTVIRTGRAARVDGYASAPDSVGGMARRAGVRSSVAVPIIVHGAVWGAIGAGSAREQFPPDAEERMAQFTELLAAAISNLDTRSDLAASRARIVEAADDERRRVVRDLHDGAQQRLVHTVVTLKLAQQAFADGDGTAAELVREALEQAELGTTELRELAHGILPAVLTHGGLAAAFAGLVSRLDLSTCGSTSRTSGCRRRSRRARTSSWPRRSPTSSSTPAPSTPRSRRSCATGSST